MGRTAVTLCVAQPPAGADGLPKRPFADHPQAVRISRLRGQVAEGDPVAAAMGEHVDGFRGNVFIDREVVGHGGHSTGDRA